MREGLELVLDKIERRIGKRDGFLVDDVLNYFLQDEGIIELHMNELAHYARTGINIDEGSIFEFPEEYMPGRKFKNEYMIFDKSLLLSKEFLYKKYADLYINDCLECGFNNSIMEWVEVQGIVIATLDNKHILCISSSIPWIYEESIIVIAFYFFRKFDERDISSIESRYERNSILKQWDSWFEEKALKLFGKQ